MAITLSGTTITVTGGTAATPLSAADIAVALPQNCTITGNYVYFTGITAIQFGVVNQQDIFFREVNKVFAADRLITIYLTGGTKDAQTNPISVIDFGTFDPAKNSGTNGCIFMPEITLIANGFININVYGSSILGTANFAGSWATVASLAGNYLHNFAHIGTMKLYRNNIIRGVISNAPPSVGTTTDTSPYGNVWTIESGNTIMFLNRSNNPGTKLLFDFSDPTISLRWSYNNAFARNVGKIPQNKITQQTAYADSVFTNYISPSFQIYDINGNKVQIQKAIIRDKQGTIYNPLIAESNYTTGFVKFPDIAIQQWKDRIGGVVGNTSYTDFSPFEIEITDTNGTIYKQPVDLSKIDNIPIFLNLYNVVPTQTRLILAETKFLPNEAHEFLYVDIPNKTVNFSILAIDQQTNTTTSIYSSTMNEISPGIYHIFVDFSTITFPTIPDYYILKAQRDNIYDIAIIEVSPNAGGVNIGFTLQDIINGVWGASTRTITNPELANLDVPVSTRLAASNYVAPDNAKIASIDTKTTNIDTKTTNIESIVGNIDTKTTNIETTTANIDTRTTNIDTTTNTTKQEVLLVKSSIANVEAIVSIIREVELGQWKIVGSKLYLFDRQGTQIAAFDLYDANGNLVSDASLATERRPI